MSPRSSLSCRFSIRTEYGFARDGGFQISKLKSQISDYKSQNAARTPLHHWHAAHGARFAECDGWRIPAVFTAVEQEVAAARSGVGLADLSAFAKISVSGRGVSAVARTLAGVGPVDKPGGVAPFATGGSVLVCRLSADRLFIVADSTGRAAIELRLETLATDQESQRHDATSAYAGFEIVGPHSLDVLRRLTAFDLSPDVTPAGTCAETNLAGVQAILVRVPERTPPATRVYVSWDFAEYIWTRLLDAGREAAITPIGADAWRRLGREEEEPNEWRETTNGRRWVLSVTVCG